MKSKREKPPEHELRALVEQRLSDKDIGQQYGVGTDAVRRWRRSYVLYKSVGCPSGFKHSDDVKAKRPRLVGEKNPFFGKKHSVETREKMSANHADITGDNNPYRKSLTDPKKKEDARKRAREIWNGRDEKWRNVFAEKMSARPITYQTGVGRNHKRGYHISSKVAHTDGKIYYRSSWELDLALRLDQCSNVVNYEYEQLRLKFKNADDQIRWTYSDFLVETVNGKRVLIEVKPTTISLLKQDRLQAQIKWCIDNSVQYAIVDKMLIESEFDNLVTMIENGELNARKYDGRGPVTPEVCLGLIRTWQSNR